MVQVHQKNVGALTIYIYVCVCVCVYIYIYICCAFIGLDNKLYKMHATYIKIKRKSFVCEMQ